MFSACRYAALAAGLSLAVPKADAAYIAYMYQNGANVVDTGSGSIDLTDLTSPINLSATIGVNAVEAYLALGQTPNTATSYIGLSSGPASFGSGGFFPPSTSSGSVTAVQGPSASGGLALAVPASYVSGTALGTSTDTWNSTTLAALGVTDGTYTWTWGAGAHADSFTLHIGEAPPATTPEPASLTLLAMGLAGLGLVLRTRRA